MPVGAPITQYSRQKRVIALMGALLLLAAVSPLSLAETFGYAAVVLLFLAAKSVVVTVAD